MSLFHIIPLILTRSIFYFSAFSLPQNPNLFVNILRINDTKLECKFTPIISADQIPNEDEGWNFLPFLPIRAQLKHHFYPMAARFDFNGTNHITMDDIENMQLLHKWIRTKSGQPAAIQFFINKCKDRRTNSCLIYYNSGIFMEIPSDESFNDLNDEDYHVMGNEWWKLWSNITWEEPRMLSDGYVNLSEPNPIRNGIKRVKARLTPNEEDFINSCFIPETWANNNTRITCTQQRSELQNEEEALQKWHKIQMDQKRLATVPINDAFFNWKFTGPPPMKDRIQFINREIQKLNFQTIQRISHNSKVKKYEDDLKSVAMENLNKLMALQEEKEFFDLNAKENEKLVNEFYLPNLHAAMITNPRKGMKVKVYEDQETQCDEEIDTSYKDWSGQWSPMHSDEDNE